MTLTIIVMTMRSFFHHSFFFIVVSATCANGHERYDPSRRRAPVQVMELRESWVHSRCPSGPTHRGSRLRENGSPRQHNGLREWHSHWRFLQGAVSLHDSRAPWRQSRAWLRRRSVLPIEISAYSSN